MDNMVFCKEGNVVFCKENCNRDVTLDDILNDVEFCNFCDVPYIFIDVLGLG